MSELPPWAENIRRKYLGNEASVFVLHSNVFDRILWEDKYYSLAEFLTKILLWENKETVLEYDPAAGVSVLKEESPGKTPREKLLNRSAKDVFITLEEILFHSKSTAAIIPYAGTVLPNGAWNMMSEQDRINVVTVHRWSLSEKLSARDNVVFLITESLSEIHSKLVSNPKVAAVEVTMPDSDTRAAVIAKSDPSMSPSNVELFAKHTAGLKAVQISTLLTPKKPLGLDDKERRAFIKGLLGEGQDAEARADKLSALTRGMSQEEIRHLINPNAPTEDKPDEYAEVLELVNKRKREIIEKECHGLIEFLDAKHDFSVVGGNPAIKDELLQIAESIKSGERSRVPMGLLFVGPMGSGKTFVAGAFANASGLSAIKLKNFRSKWVGSTEGNLEKVLGMVRALGPIILIIDEGDRAFGGGGESDGGTSSRIIARLKEFMSETENRGRVLFIMMTNRPDKLDVDIKRAGRLDRKIPFFYPYECKDVESILDALFRRHELTKAFDWSEHRDTTSELLKGYSAADLEAVVLMAHDIADGREVNLEAFSLAASDYMPPRDTHMLE